MAFRRIRHLLFYRNRDRTTIVAVHERGKRVPTLIEPERIEAIRHIWEKEEAYIRPANLEERVAAILK